LLINVPVSMPTAAGCLLKRLAGVLIMRPRAACPLGMLLSGLSEGGETHCVFR
jgi:hypothetical protein